jgi:hypothetical protein
VEGLRKTTALLLTVFIIASLAPALAQQQEYRVVLRGEPEDCAAVLAGEGSYPIASPVAVEARATTNCRFVKWVVVKGLQYSETASNPLTFYIDRDVELVAVFERLYEKPGGQPVERVIVYITTNVTGLPEQQPLITMPNSELRYGFERELYLGDAKYVFLYAEVGGERYNMPSLRIRVPESGQLRIKAYYYTYIRFINEYYPKDQFIKPDIEPVKQVGDGVRLRATGYMVANTTFPIDQPVPKQLARFVEPKYIREYRLRVVSDGAPAAIEVNGVRYSANPVAEAWIKEGTQITVTAPEKLERHRLERVEAGGLAVVGSMVVGPVNSPATITLKYRELPNAQFLDIPVIGLFMVQVADLGTAITGFEGVMALISGLLVMASPAAAISAAAFLRPSAVRRRIGGGVRADPEMSTVTAAIAASLPSRRAGNLNQALRASGRLQVHPALKEAAEEIAYSSPQTALLEEEVSLGQESFIPKIRQEAEQLIEKLRSGEKVKLTPEHIASIECDIDTYDLIRNAVENGLADIKGGLGFLGYEVEGMKAEKALQLVRLLVLASPDLRLGELVAGEACRRAGMSYKKAEPPKSADLKKAAAELKKAAGGARALIHVVEDEAVERSITRAAPLTGITHIVISKNPVLPPAVEIEEPSKERYVSIAAAYAASKGLVERLTHEHVDYIAEIAYAFRGVASIEEAVSRLAAEKKRDVYEVLRELFRDETANVFTREELRLITSCTTLEELRNSYMAYVRQTRPGTRPEAEWATMYERLRRLGVVS